MKLTKHFKRTAFPLSAKSMVSLMLLLIAMLMPQGVWADEFITAVTISAGTTAEEAKKQLREYDYKVLDKDLNGGGGGWYVYIGYKTSTNIDNAITDLLIVESGGGFQCCAINASCMYNGIMYYYVNCPNTPIENGNLNRGRGTSTPDIALYCTGAGNKADGGTPITSINVVERTDVPDVEYVRHWKYGEDMNKTTNTDVYGNTNMGGNATAHYITVTKHTHKLVYSSFNEHMHKITCEGAAHCHYGTDYKNHDLGTEEYFSHDATCQKGRLYYKKCKVCGNKGPEYEVGEPLGHDLITHEATEPTCSADGNILYYTCSRSCCEGSHFIKSGSGVIVTARQNTIIAKLPHEFNDKGVCVNNASHYEEPVKSDDAQYDYFTQEWYDFDYLIANYGNLCWFRDEANSGKTIRGKLTADINLSGMPWATSIGEGKEFAGTFDGQGHTITGNARKALFCVLAAGSTVKNVVSTGATSKENYENAAYQSPFVRRNYGTIENCIVKSAYWDSRSSYLGGITGVNETGGIVRNCGFYDSTLRLRNGANTQVGGIVGVNCSNGRIENCFTWGINYYNIGSLGSGGIVCENRSGAIVSNCYTNVATPVFKQEGTATNLTSGITAAFITTGEMCYKLNGGTTNGTQIWYQKIGTETYPTPVLKNTANTVYQIANFKCDGKTVSTNTFTYSNNASANRAVDGHGLSEYTPTYTWEGTYATPTCTFTLKCNQCNTVVSTQNLTPTKVDANHVDATCVKAGNERWTATGSYSKAGDATYNGTAQVNDYAIPAAHTFNDETDPHHTLCTVCDHSFFRYTATAKVEPYTPENLKNAKGQGIYNKDKHTFNPVNHQGVMEFDEPLATIGNRVFYLCYSFTGTLTIPNSVTSIGDDAFCRCSGFTGNLTIPNSVTSIGNGAFSGCSGFNGTLTIPNSVTSIGESAFSGCSGFNGTLTIPNSVTSIGIYAFYGCSGFTGNLTIPNSVTSIGNRTFYECSGFTGNLTIPNSVTSIGNSAFYGCSGFNGNLTIPNSVTSIVDKAFYGCSRLTGVELNSVPQIGNDTFYKVTSNKTVVLSDNSYVYTGSNPNFPALQSASYTRTGIKNQWGTIVVPFDVENGDEYDFYTLSSLSGDELTLTKVNGRLTAGTPALIRINRELVDGKTYDLTLRAVSLVVDAQGTLTGTPANGLTLTGSYSVKDITEEDGYIISNNKFWSIQDVKGDNNVYCAPFRAYLKASAPAHAKALSIGISEEVDVIEAITAITEGNVEFYDINGRKQNNLQTGVNIVKYSNGKTKKVIIK